MWNDIAALKALSQVLLWVVILFGVASIAATGFRYYVDRRVGELIESSRADRTITDAQERTTLEALKPILSGKPVVVFTDLRTKEAERFAEKIEGLIRAAGITVNTRNGILPGNSSDTVRIESSQSRKSEAESIGKAFTAAKIVDGPVPWSSVPDPIAEPDGLTIFVGAKP